MLLATPPLGIGASSLGRVFPVEAEGTAQCSSDSHSVISGELQQKILTRPNVEVKFSNNVTFKVTFY